MPPRRDADFNISDDSEPEDDELDEDYNASRTIRTKGKGKGKGKELGAYAWEASYKRSWDTVQEDEAGSLQAAVQDLVARSKRRRCACSWGDAPIRRTIIRHMMFLVDLSTAMMDRDMRPSRFDLTLSYAREFVSEWFDQNPLGQMGVVGMRNGVGERIGDMSGNPQDVLKCFLDKTLLEPAGEPSLQNSIEMARASMNHLPTHSSREILIIFGSLTTVDPGNLLDTVDACVRDQIRISIVALSAEMKVCRDMCERTGGVFGVALNEGHYKDLLFELVPPPADKSPVSRLAAQAGEGQSELMQMGFPTRLPATAPPSLCVCHSRLRSEGYICPRCNSKVCDVPTDCDICGLMIVSSPHLARSYHHLFPAPAYKAVLELDGKEASACHACSLPFPTTARAPLQTEEGMSPHGRYRCPKCKHDFDAECDLFVHDVLHVCPGCG
ncbi:TFIIH basal transcription factor complex subunit SSL1 [Dacryopinax primogenitus]|uniref:General transcription and DNA repair factor IIH n=1 Tax=Dacryopinax primogenitus (strain DJM 731) TaxID=1858805 RepID=M5GCU6_DACPD|nr:TFIIH basal transcription factor complex subunit SSL1 [Dacryopinax primogenitus]EJU04067.1 TFIIH basal transcription factor complex subunit SSL1 [Dacryopinax primogenitus]